MCGGEVSITLAQEQRLVSLPYSKVSELVVASLGFLTHNVASRWGWAVAGWGGGVVGVVGVWGGAVVPASIPVATPIPTRTITSSPTSTSPVAAVTPPPATVPASPVVPSVT